jgi:hypothetical protein
VNQIKELLQSRSELIKHSFGAKIFPEEAPQLKELSNKNLIEVQLTELSSLQRLNSKNFPMIARSSFFPIKIHPEIAPNLNDSPKNIPRLPPSIPKFRILHQPFSIPSQTFPNPSPFLQLGLASADFVISIAHLSKMEYKTF